MGTEPMPVDHSTYGHVDRRTEGRMALEHRVNDGVVSDRSPNVARTMIRMELAEAISGIVERDRFLQRTAQLVSRQCGQPFVAIYTRGAAGGGLVLRSSTLPPTSPAPARLTSPGAELSNVVRSSSGTGNTALVTPLRVQGDAIGALVVFQERGEFSVADRLLVETVAMEIAPAVAVAEQHHAIKQASVVDLSSGAYTTWFLKQRLDEEIERARRQSRDVSLLLLNVFGVGHVWRETNSLHPASVLRELANVLTSSTRMFDIVAQRAPGEFAILLVDAGEAAVPTVAERIRARVLRALERALPHGVDIDVVASSATFPVDGDDASGLILTAEHRLDAALRRRTLNARS